MIAVVPAAVAFAWLGAIGLVVCAFGGLSERWLFPKGDPVWDDERTEMIVADSVTFEETERGWVMVVETDQGHTLRVGVHSVAWGLVPHVDATLGRWRREGEDARATMPERAT